MKIATRLTAGALLPLFTAALLLLVMAFGFNQVNRALELEERVRQLGSGALELGLLTYAYLQHPDERKRRLWDAQHEHMEQLFASVSFATPDQRALASQMRRSLDNIRRLFEHLLITNAPESPVRSAALQRRLETQLGISIRNIASVGNRLEVIIVEETGARMRQVVSSLVLLVALLALIGFVTLQTLNGSILRSIRALHRGTERVGAGDLDHRLGMPEGDELGQLGAAFDHMAAQLKEITVSRDALAAEMAERVKVERALSASETRARLRERELETLLLTVPTPLFISRDPACRQIRTNEAGARLLGIAADAPFTPAAEPFAFCSHGEPIPVEGLPMQVAARTGREVEAEVFEVRRADGSHRFITGRAVPLYDAEGALSGALGAFIDVTDLVLSEQELARRAAELERMNQELESFAYAASHDLKAPLRAVANLAHWIDEEAGAGLDSASRERLALLRSRIIRMDRLIDGLLAYSRTGRPDPEACERVELGPLLADLVRELGLPPGFRVELAPGLPALRAEPPHLRQIFQNLILNAVHHHDRPSGQITIRARQEEQRVRIEVADDGPGIAPAWRETVFRMFATLKASNDEQRTGIGLALVKKLVLAYGGTISVADNSPRGALFTLLLPRAEAAAATREKRAGVG